MSELVYELDLKSSAPWACGFESHQSYHIEKEMKYNAWSLPIEENPFVKDDGTILWLDKDARPHRENGPARISPGGLKSWYKHGKLHREDGPAIYYKDETIGPWFINGKRVLELEKWK